MNEITQEFYDKVLASVPLSDGSISWKQMPKPVERKFVSAFNISRKREILPTLETLLFFDFVFSKEELRKYADERNRQVRASENSKQLYFDYFGGELKEVSRARKRTAPVYRFILEDGTVFEGTTNEFTDYLDLSRGSIQYLIKKKKLKRLETGKTKTIIFDEDDVISPPHIKRKKNIEYALEAFVKGV